jgi:osmotically-inducible protein OsmY
MRSVAAALLLLTALVPMLQGCVPVVAGAAVGAGVLLAEDRRSSGTYVDDQSIELKTTARISEKLPAAHVNVTSFNRVTLLTGEAPTEAAKAEIGAMAQAVAGVRAVQNELAVKPNSSAGARANDAAITANVKTRFVQAGKFQANHVKVVTEANVVYLMGLVKRSEAADAASVASRSKGVSKVVQVFEFID